MAGLDCDGAATPAVTLFIRHYNDIVFCYHRNSNLINLIYVHIIKKIIIKEKTALRLEKNVKRMRGMQK